MSTSIENQFNFAAKSHISISRIDHSTSIMKSVDDIFQKQLFTDVCLSCENQIINAHRLILAASTSFFHSLFSQKPCCLTQNPVIVIRDMKINELKAILEFIYYGNITVAECDLDSLIKSANSLGVYGLNNLNKDKINELKDDQEHESEEVVEEEEINNNSINQSNKSNTPAKCSGPQRTPTIREQLSNRASLLNKNSSNQSNNNNQMQYNTSVVNSSANKNSTNDKSKRKFTETENNDQQSNEKQQSELDRTQHRDLEEKRKKRELLNLTSSLISEQQSTSSQDPSSKRQSLRIRYRKNNPDPTKEANSAFNLLNTSNNSEISLSDTLASANGKRLKRTNSDSNLGIDEELMSVDGSEYNNSRKEGNNSQGHSSPEASNSTNILSATKLQTVKALKRDKNSILKKQSDHTKQFKLMLNKSNTDNYTIASKTTPDEVASEEDISNLQIEENIVVLKKTDSASGSRSTSSKSSLDSNSGSLLRLNRTAGNNDKQSSQDSQIGEPSSLGSNQSQQQSSSLLAISASSNLQQSKNGNTKKRRRISIDSNT